MDFMFDWEAEGDRISFEDSDRFEEDSLCSWISEPESLCNNWRGWRKQNGGPQPGSSMSRDGAGSGISVRSLVEIAAQAVACHIPFEVVEHFYPPIPEQLQLRIAFWSFPENEEDIRLYSCLANGSADEFQKGEHLFKARAVKDALQIGFHLSATVIPPQTLAQAKGAFNVAVVFDRRRITSCNCTCSSTASWCAHVVALCLYRIHLASSVCLRAPVSESLSRLHRDQLQKFAQYLISELPQQILPTAQRLLDELLSSQQTAINTVCGAPDPTAGPSASEQTTWCLDEDNLHENIKKTLIKFCVPSPIVFSDVNYLSSTAPPAAAEWQSLLRPLRGREPEGMWNLLSIIREMFRRNDSNAIPLLKIQTEEVLTCEQILIWWFHTKVSASHNSTNVQSQRGGGNNASNSSQHAASSLCDEIVTLWRLAALNPALSSIQRDDLTLQLKDWHIKTIDKVRKGRSNMSGGGSSVKKVDMEIFPGFKPAIEACQLTWEDYYIPGITFVEKGRRQWRFSYNRLSEGDRNKTSRPKAQNIAVHKVSLMDSVKPGSASLRRKTQDLSVAEGPAIGRSDGACSSGSEGFCENERLDGALNLHDSDSDDGNVYSLAKATSIVVHQNHTASSNDQQVSPRKETTNSKAGGSHVTSGQAGSDRKNKNEEDESDSSMPEGGACAAAASTTAAVPGNAAKVRVDLAEQLNNSSDEYQVYFYNTSAKVPDLASDKKKKADEPNYFAGIKKVENKVDILFARAEALHAHGHTHHACRLAMQLAEEMLANPPDLTMEAPQINVTKGKKKKSQGNTSSFASTTLAKAAFLCNVLLEDVECHHLAFKVGMFGLEMPRPPASSKALEVKLAYQESELAGLLKKIPLGHAELNIIRDRAEKLRDGKLKSRGEALLPLMLASFIFESLCLPAGVICGSSSRPPSRSVHVSARQPSDEALGFEAGVAAIGLKANVSEAEHPLLCEGTRRQRGDLAIAMLVHYKDDQERLSKVMDKLLDKEVHQLYKAPSLSTYLSSSSRATISMATSSSSSKQQVVVSVSNSKDSSLAAAQSASYECDEGLGDTPPATSAGQSWDNGGCAQRLEYLDLEQKLSNMSLRGAGPQPVRPLNGRHNSHGNKDTDSSAMEEDGEGGADYKAWEAKFRCTNLKTIKKHSVGMASIDSSAPETTSSDNSPTLVRRNWAKHQGPGSDSGSSGKSSDSLRSSNSGEKGAMAKTRDDESPPGLYGMRFAPHLVVDSRSSTPNVKGARFKGKSRITPTVPNQPSEASAHFMFELAKTLLGKAGGSSATSLFTQPTSTNNHSGPHRALHLCAFQTGLYALGLHNCVSPNWLSRTYSSHVSWITGQAMEIGSAAINILIDTWEGHLTPPEVASLADRASRGCDPNMVRAAAKLALSCLPHAHALNPNEIQRALIQCKEQSQDMLESACLAVESAAKGGGVYPEVLFDVAKRWFELYEESLQGQGHMVAGDHCVQVLAGADGELQQALVPLQPAGGAVVDNTSPPTVQLIPVQLAASANSGLGQGAAPAAVPIPYSLTPPAPNHPQFQHGTPQYLVTYSYMQPLHNFSHIYSQPHIPLHTHSMHPPYLATYPYQNMSHLQSIHAAANPNAATTLYHTRHSQPATAVQVYQRTQLVAAAAAQQNHHQILANHAQPVQQMEPSALAAGQAGQNAGGMRSQVVAAAPAPAPAHSPHQHDHQLVTSQNSHYLNYLNAAYRVGMLAMETLARRVHDDRPQTKYARNPPYGEDVKWLLTVAMKLGTSYLQQFCASAVNAVVSPFVLHDIAIEAAHCLSRNNPTPTQVSSNLRSPILNSLVQKCLQMFIQCSHQRMHHITQPEYDEFVNIVCSARNAFCMTPGGLVQFNEFLQSLRRAKSCKKDLWLRIMNGLATTGNAMSNI